MVRARFVIALYLKSGEFVGLSSYTVLSGGSKMGATGREYKKLFLKKFKPDTNQTNPSGRYPITYPYSLFLMFG